MGPKSRKMHVMTSLPDQVSSLAIQATPAGGAAGDPLVFAAGSTYGRRLMRAGIGLVLMGAGWLFWVLLPRDWGERGLMLLGSTGVILLLLAFWQRGRAFEVRREGIRLQHGGNIFGESTLIPWESITFFGAKSVREGEVCLVYRQQHVGGTHTLPGSERSEVDYAALIDRLQFLIGDRYPNLQLGVF